METEAKRTDGRHEKRTAKRRAWETGSRGAKRTVECSAITRIQNMGNQSGMDRTGRMGFNIARWPNWQGTSVALAPFGKDGWNQ